MQFQWTVAWPSPALSSQPERWNRVDGDLQLFRVMHIGSRDGHRQRHAVAVHDDVTLCAQLAAIRRILARRFAPPGAGTLALSSEARVQSMRPAFCSRCRSARCKRFHTPACCQSRKRRQQVIPLPQPSSWGSISHGMPLFKTNTMPVKAARSVMLRGRPPLGLGGSGGKRGATISHNLSLINGVLMPPIYHTAWVLLGALSADSQSDSQRWRTSVDIGEQRRMFRLRTFSSHGRLRTLADALPPDS
jgi:hypothetical protein